MQIGCNSLCWPIEDFVLKKPLRKRRSRGASPLAARVRKAREERGLSRRELAEKAGVALRTIFNLESGERRPRGKTLRKILEALDKTPKLPEV